MIAQDIPGDGMPKLKKSGEDILKCSPLVSRMDPLYTQFNLAVLKK